MPTTKAKFQITAEDRTKQAFQSVNRNLGGFKSALAGLGIGASVAAFARISKSSLEFADSIDKVSQVAGLTSETLQKLRFAGEQVGLTTKDVDEGFRRFNRRLGEFVNSGGGPAAKALEKLGITLDDVKGKATGEIFERVTRELNKFENQAQRAALEAQLFGDDAGPKMDLLVSQGVDAIHRLGIEAQSTGAILSNETVAKAARATEELDKLAAGIRGNLTTAFVNLSPVIIEVTQVIADATAGFAAFFDLFDKPEVDTSLDGMRDKLFRLTDEAVELRATLASTDKESALFAGLQRRLEEVNTLINETNQGMLDLQTAGDSTGGSTPTTPPAAVTSSQAAPAGPVGISKAVEQALPGQREWNALIDEAASLTRALRTPTEEYYDDVAKYKDLLDRNLITQETFTRGVEDSWSRVADSAKGSVDEISEFTRSAFESMQNATSDLFFSVMQGDLDDLAGNFKRTIDRMVADLLSSKLLEAAFGVGGQGGGFVGAAATAIGAFLGSGKAIGGTVFPDVTYPINEIEPEFFKPNIGGKVIPLSKMDPADIGIRGAGAGGVTVNQYITSPDVNGFRLNSRQIAQDSRRQQGQSRANS